MWKFEEKIIVRATPEQIWGIWTKVEDWPKWDHGVEWSSLEGLFENGSKIKLKPKKGPKVTAHLFDVIPFKEFSDVMRMPLTKVIFHHRLESKGGHLSIVHGLEIHGLLTPLLKRTLGLQIKKELPSALSALIKLAEESS